jgi:hypothetical protein
VLAAEALHRCLSSKPPTSHKGLGAATIAASGAAFLPEAAIELAAVPVAGGEPIMLRVRGSRMRAGLTAWHGLLLACRRAVRTYRHIMYLGWQPRVLGMARRAARCDTEDRTR